MSKDGDRIVIKAMRVAVWGLGLVILFFVVHIVVTFAVSVHDNRRIHELEQRVKRLEVATPAERP